MSTLIRFYDLRIRASKIVLTILRNFEAWLKIIQHNNLKIKTGLVRKTNVSSNKFVSLVVFHVLRNSKLVLLLAMKPILVGQQQVEELGFWCSHITNPG